MSSTVTNILDLNDKVLCHLFSYLRVTDKLKLLLIKNDRLNTLANHMVDNEYLDMFDIPMEFSLEESKFILSNYGRLFKRFRFASSFDDEGVTEYLEYVPTYCTNLEDIFLSGFEITVTNPYGRLLAISNKLHTLKLKNCILGNKAGFLISKLTELQTLDLEDSKVTGKGLYNLQKLVDLNLKRCRNFKCANFIELCKSNQLKTLNIVGFKQLTCAATKALLETQTNLSKLIVGNTYWSKEFTKICLLKNLREISVIAREEEVVLTYLKELVGEHHGTLESLEIYLPNVFCNFKEYMMEMAFRVSEFENLKVLSFRNCPLFEDPHLVLIARSSKHLEMLDLSGTSFTEMGIIGCVECLDSLRYLDVSYCKVSRNLYSRLVAKRRRSTTRLCVFVNTENALVLAQNDACNDWKHLVTITTKRMRLKNEKSTVERLEQLNLLYSCCITSQHDVVPLSYCEEQNGLFQLGENCLYHITQYLGIIDQLTLVLTDEHFANIVKYFLRTELVDIVQIMSNFTIFETRTILSRCGHTIKRLKMSASIYHFTPDYFDVFAEFCDHLEEIQCHVGLSEQLSVKCTNLMTKSAETLKIVRMQHWNVADSDLFILSKLCNLETLLLVSPNVSGLYLEKLTKLHTLELSQCYNLDPSNFDDICRTNRLKKLDIKECRQLDSTSFQVLADTQFELESLSIGGAYAATNFQVLAQLKNLKHITLHECTPQDANTLLHALSESKNERIQSLGFECFSEMNTRLLFDLKTCMLNFPKLEYLRLQSNDMIDNIYMKRFVRACPRLRMLDVHGAINLKNEGILEAVRHLDNLLYLDINFCGFDDAAGLYRDIVAIKKERGDTEPLYLDIRNREGNLDGVSNTKEYKALEKYVVLPDGFWYGKAFIIDKEELLKQRRKKPIPTKNTILPENEIHINEHPTESMILKLSNNCLVKIASYLATIDKLKLITVSDRFLYAFRKSIKDLLFDVNEISASFTLFDAQKLFDKCGGQIRRVKYTVALTNNPLEYLGLVEPYKSHLKEIYLDDCCHIWPEGVCKLFSCKSQRLEKIILRDYYPLEPLLADMSNSWEECTDLFKNLTDLHLTDCYPVQTVDFILLCQSSKLKSLDIRGCSQLQNEAFIYLIATQSDCLEWLGISCDYVADNYSDVSFMKNLKHIVIECHSNVSQLEILLDKLVKWKRNDLRSLEIQNIKDTHRVFDYSLIYRIVEDRRSKFSSLKDVKINQAYPYVKPYHY